MNIVKFYQLLLGVGPESTSLAPDRTPCNLDRDSPPSPNCKVL
ncbi:hypothetical protein [Microcoleus sp. OTE_8_concoct_300]